MPDYEDLILQRQEMTEILEDDCSGDCDYCPWKRERSNNGWVQQEFYATESMLHYYCGLYEED